MREIQMVDLSTPYQRMKQEVDEALLNAVASTQYVNGEPVGRFCDELADFTGSNYIIPCANGTDALQIALMALDLKEEDEVIVPAFTYAAAVEAVALLKLTPVLVDINPQTYNMDVEKITDAISSKTKAIIPVHLFGQSCDMEPILKIARNNKLSVIEDNAQSIGATYRFADGTEKQTGTMGNTGTLSFFPTKNLACFGDGGAMMTQEEELAARLKMIASHGQSEKYIHQRIGCNSRLDTLQAAVLSIKLKYLNDSVSARRAVAKQYRQGLEDCPFIEIQHCPDNSTHVYHQFTIRVKNGLRNELRDYLNVHSIPTTVYYPVPIHKQPAYRNLLRKGSELKESERLCEEVLSLPMHAELSEDQIEYILSKITDYGTKI